MESPRTKEKEKAKDFNGKTKDKIEPSKVVVLPDVAIRGTDSNNMQIKELKSKTSHGIWLAVHIPDNATAFRPVKILSTKKAAEDLEKVIGPNKETMFKELQTIIGVDGATLRKMLKSGQIDEKFKKKHKAKEEEDEEEEEEDEESDVENDKDEEEKEEEEKEEEEKEGDEDDDSGDDKKCEDEEDEEENENKEEEEEEEDEEDEDEDEDGDDNKNAGKHKNKKLKKLKSLGKKCSRKILPWTLGDNGSGADSNDETVLQPQGYKTPLASFLNKVQNDLKREKACKHAHNPIIKELCKQMDRNHNHPHPNFNQPRRHHLAHRKYYNRLKRLMRRFFNRHSGKQAKQVMQYMNFLLSDQLRLSKDGLVHLYPNVGKNINNYGDGFKVLADDYSESMAGIQNSPPLEPPVIDDNMYNGHVIRVPVPGSTREKTSPDIGIVSNSQANIMNNQAHTKLGDSHSEADTQVQMLKEELGRSNDELREQQKEKERDESIMEKYKFNFQTLAEKGPSTTFNGMQKDAEERVNEQQVSVVDPNQITLKQSRLPTRVDVPSLGGFVGGHFTGFSRRNKIRRYLKKVSAKTLNHQHKESLSRKTTMVSQV